MEKETKISISITIGGILLLLSIVYLLFWAIGFGEKRECQLWAQEKKDFTAWQYEQCAHYNIKINDRVVENPSAQ